MSKIYDVIVLGAGPAGLSAGLYAGRSRLSVLIVEKGQDGGQISITDEIENYPGQIVDQSSKVKKVSIRQRILSLLQVLMQDQSVARVRQSSLEEEFLTALLVTLTSSRILRYM